MFEFPEQQFLALHLLLRGLEKRLTFRISDILFVMLRKCRHVFDETKPSRTATAASSSLNI